VAPPDHAALFSYGTLQLEPVQTKVFGRLLQGDEDVLLGFAVEQIEIANSTYPIAVKSTNPAQEIPGRVFFISAEELAAADEYEGAEYQRVEVTLKSGHKAWVYVKPAHAQ